MYATMDHEINGAENRERRAHLRVLMEEHRCWPSWASEENGAKMADYDDTYEDMATSYLGVSWGDYPGRYQWEGRVHPDNMTLVPKYASIIHDETYSMIDLYDDLNEALTNALGNDGDTLTGAGSVIDLDTGQQVESRTVVMTKAAYNRACIIINMMCEEGATSEELLKLFPKQEES